MNTIENLASNDGMYCLILVKAAFIFVFFVIGAFFACMLYRHLRYHDQRPSTVCAICNREQTPWVTATIVACCTVSVASAVVGFNSAIGWVPMVLAFLVPQVLFRR